MGDGRWWMSDDERERKGRKVTSDAGLTKMKFSHLEIKTVRKFQTGGLHSQLGFQK
jgi:hypothetical protein